MLSADTYRPGNIMVTPGLKPNSSDKRYIILRSKNTGLGQRHVLPTPSESVRWLSVSFLSCIS